ncbi:hypothetical protein HPP92_010816 [Vanilla planifolia]|uniref:Uncharacterized protein n=1 Tax=Vanilla planifolia TaxID=51239 RepID=A0A835RA73_VANPL|nr:hypothetical protein HPP92_010816 [Vanilla planifolia]
MEAVDRSKGCLEEFYLGILGMMSSCSISLIVYVDPLEFETIPFEVTSQCGFERGPGYSKAYAAANSASTNVNLDENLKRKCARIKVLRLPDDSFYDFHMDVNIGELQVPPEEYDSDLGSFGFDNDCLLLGIGLWYECFIQAELVRRTLCCTALQVSPS